MAPVIKGKTSTGLSKGMESRGPIKNVGMSKFKIYSENDKVQSGRNRDDVGGVTSSTSLVSKKGTLLANKSGLKDLASGAGKTSGTHDTHGKMIVGRKALADVSNVRGYSSRLEKPGSSRNLMTSGTLSSIASSCRPPVGKVKAKLTHDAAASGISLKASIKAARNSSNFPGKQIRETAENIPRQISKSNCTSTRKSFPVVKKASQLGANSLQGDVGSSEKPTRKLGFPLKTRVGGTVVSQVSNLKGKALKDRVSDGFILTARRNQTNKDVPQRLRQSIKPVASTSQTSNIQKNTKAKRISSLDKSLATTSSRREKATESSMSKTSTSLDCHGVSERELPADDKGNKEPNISHSTASKRSKRRKSYTSLLISRSKLLEKDNEVVELEKLPNIDNESNPLEVAEYVDDIYQYYWILEAQSASLEDYMTVQTDVTPQMRGILVNWLIEVHSKFDLMPETLYLAVALLDRYLSLVPIKKKEMQLVGLTSLLLASKYEDFWHPRVKDLISISAESYTRKQMLEMEKGILKKLKFRLNLPTAYVFMLRFLKASQSDEQLEQLAFYLIEVCLLDYEALKFRPSLLCASAVYIARCTLNKLPAWTPLLAKHARYEESQIRDCAAMVLRVHRAASAGLLRVTYEKYMKSEFGRVAAIKPMVRLPL